MLVQPDLSIICKIISHNARNSITARDTVHGIVGVEV